MVLVIVVVVWVVDLVGEDGLGSWRLIMVMRRGSKCWSDAVDDDDEKKGREVVDGRTAYIHSCAVNGLLPNPSLCQKVVFVGALLIDSWPANGLGSVSSGSSNVHTRQPVMMLEFSTHSSQHASHFTDHHIASSAIIRLMLIEERQSAETLVHQMGIEGKEKKSPQKRIHELEFPRFLK
jgi:hypothetical protein